MNVAQMLASIHNPTPYIHHNAKHAPRHHEPQTREQINEERFKSLLSGRWVKLEEARESLGYKSLDGARSALHTLIAKGKVIKRDSPVKLNKTGLVTKEYTWI